MSFAAQIERSFFFCTSDSLKTIQDASDHSIDLLNSKASIFLYSTQFGLNHKINSLPSDFTNNMTSVSNITVITPLSSNLNHSNNIDHSIDYVNSTEIHLKHSPSHFIRPHETLRQHLFFAKDLNKSKFDLITLDTFPSSVILKPILNNQYTHTFLPSLQMIMNETSYYSHEYCDPNTNKSLSKEEFEECFYSYRQYKLHVSPVPVNYTFIYNSLLEDQKKPTYFYEDSILYGQYIVLPPSHISTIDYEEYYHPYNPIQIYDSNTTIKYLYQEYRDQGISSIPGLSSLYQPTFFFFPVGTRFSFFMFPKHKEIQDLFNNYHLVFIFKSSSKNINKRKGIRETWANNENKKKYNFTVYFVISKDLYPSSSMKLIKEEEDTYQDIIGTNIVEDYMNNTLKVFMIEDLIVQSNTTTHYFVIGDDDICLNVPRFMSYVPKERNNTLYSGIRRVSIPGISVITKWNKPYYCLPWDLPFVYGPAVLLSKDIIEKHVRTFPYMEYLYQSDDVILSQLSLYNNIEPIFLNEQQLNADIFIKKNIVLSNSSLFYLHHTEYIHFKRLCH
ncbi:hypothetical protein WA158_005406 [Blastocystis sp. Blastoise]